MARFELSVTPSAADMDQNGHVNNIVYLRWVQDAATAHWNALALPQWHQTFVWVVLRHEIDYLKPCFAGDALTLQTWTGDAPRGARFVRYVDVYRDTMLLAKACTSWAMLHQDSLRPARVTAEMAALFAA